MIWQEFEEKDSLLVAQFVLGYPPSVEVQGLTCGDNGISGAR